MKQYRDQARKDQTAKANRMAGAPHRADGGADTGGGGGMMPNHKDIKAGMKSMMTPGGGMPGKARGGKAHKTPKSHKEPGPSAKELLARPVPASGAMAEPVSAIRPVSSAPTGLSAMMGAGGLKTGGRAHRANGGRAHHMTAGAGSGEGRLEKIGKKP